MNLEQASQHYRDAVAQDNALMRSYLYVNGVPMRSPKGQYHHNVRLPRARERLLLAAANYSGDGKTRLEKAAKTYRECSKNPFRFIRMRRAKNEVLHASLTGGPIMNVMG